MAVDATDFWAIVADPHAITTAECRQLCPSAVRVECDVESSPIDSGTGDTAGDAGGTIIVECTVWSPASCA